MTDYRDPLEIEMERRIKERIEAHERSKKARKLGSLPPASVG